MFKVLRIEGDAANRDLGEHIHKKVAEFLESANAEMTDLKINADLSTTYGRALVTIFYKEKAPKKQKKGR